MITLTTPIAVPNVTRVRVTGVQMFDDAATAVVTVQVLSPAAGGRAQGYTLRIQDTGRCDRLKANATPISFGDPVVVDSFTPAAGRYAALEAAYRTAGGKAAAYRAVETQLLTDGILHASLTGPVS